MALRAVVRLEFLESIRPPLLMNLLRTHANWCINYNITLYNPAYLAEHPLEPLASDPSWVSKVYRFINREHPQPLASILLQIRDLSHDPEIDYFGDAISFDPVNPPLTPAERALLVYDRDPTLFQRAHLSALPVRPCNFVEFSGPKPSSFDAESPARIAELQTVLGAWFRQKHCTSYCDVHALQMAEEVRWGIIHGRRPRSHGQIEYRDNDDPARRVSTYIPDQHDLAILCLNSGRLLVNARSMDEVELYRQRLGEVYWGHTDHFALTHVYSLKPFQLQGEQIFSCDDVEGIERVELRQIDFQKPQANTVSFNIKGKNLRQDLPPGTIDRFLEDYAVHCVKLACYADKTSDPQLITIRPPNRIAFDIRADNSAAFKYLIAKGMMSVDLKQASLFSRPRR